MAEEKKNRLFGPSLLQDIVWGNASADERLRIARIVFRGAVIALFGWSFGVLAPLGLAGFAKSDEVESKITDAIRPMEAQLGQITTQLAKQEEIQRRILLGQLSAQLRDLNRLRCSTTDDTMRARMERDIEEAEQEYKTLAGERYPLPACKDL